MKADCVVMWCSCPNVVGFDLMERLEDEDC